MPPSQRVNPYGQAGRPYSGAIVIAPHAMQFTADTGSRATASDRVDPALGGRVLMNDDNDLPVDASRAFWSALSAVEAFGRSTLKERTAIQREISIEALREAREQRGRIP